MLKGFVKIIWMPLTKLDRLPCKAKLAVRPAAPKAATKELMFTPSWATALTPATTSTTAFTKEPKKLAASASTLPLEMAFFVSRAARRAKSHPPKKISAARTKSPAKFASPWRKPLHIPCQSIIALTLSKTVTFTFAATSIAQIPGKNSERTMKFLFPCQSAVPNGKSVL